MNAVSIGRYLKSKANKAIMILVSAVLVATSVGLYSGNVFAGSGGDRCVDGIPGAAYSVLPSHKGVGTLEVVFDGSYSYQCDTPIVSYVWDFDDGTTASGATATHQFGVGTFNPSLTITDEEGLTNTASYQEIVIKADNQNPIFNDITATAFPQSTLRINITDYVSDPDGDELGSNYSLEGAEYGQGLVTDKGDAYLHAHSGVLEYRARGYSLSGQDVLTLTVNDGFGGVDSATVTISLENYIEGNDDYAETYKDEPITIDVLANDTSYHGEGVEIGSYTYENENGGSTVNGDGTVTFYPNTGFTGTGRFRYVINSSDPNKAGTSQAYVYINVVERPNQSPVAEDDSLTLNEDSYASVNVLANDHDADGDSLTVAIVVTPEHGVGTIDSTGTLHYSPAANYYGSDMVTYSLTDSKGNTDTAMVAITVNSVNDVPSAINDNVAVDEDSSVTVDVLGNDSDTEDGNNLTVSVVSMPRHGLATVNNDGTTSYVPEGNYNGNDSFTYRVTDSSGASTDAIVSVVVRSVNDAPSAAFSSSVSKSGNATFDAGESADIDGYIVGYRWDFGDGTSATSTSSSMTHKYKAKSALVTLVVTDNNGAETTYSAVISR